MTPDISCSVVTVLDRALLAVVCAAVALLSALVAAVAASAASEIAVPAFVSASAAAEAALSAASCASAAFETPSVPLLYALWTALAVPARTVELLSISSLSWTIPASVVLAVGRSSTSMGCSGKV